MKMFSIIFAALVLAVSCEDKSNVMDKWPWEDPEVEVPDQCETPEQPDVEDATLDKWSEVTSE